MTISETLLPEYDQEIATTRQFIERIPAKDAAWKPHPKSASLGELALHLATMPRWVVATMTTTGLDVATEPVPAPATTVEGLLAVFDKDAAAGRAALGQAGDADFDVPWTLRSGERVFFTLPRGPVLRSLCLSHLIHHRAQLGVYLRLQDVPLPPCYGPTADAQP